MIFYVLTSEDLSGLGGPMGSERTRDNWHKYFLSVDSAKDYARQDYKKQYKGPKPKTLEWFSSGPLANTLRTQDLGFVMYHVRPAQFEDEKGERMIDAFGKVLE